MGHPCLGLVVKLQSHDPPGHWPGCGGRWVGGRPSVVAGGTLRARGYSGSQDLGRWWPWARSQRGALLVGTHSTPLTGSQVWVVRKHLSFTHICVGTRHRRTLQHFSYMHMHARTCSDHMPYSAHMPRHQAHSDTQTHTHYTHVRLLSHTLLSPSTSLSHAHTHLPPGSLTAHCPGESEQINHEKPPLPATRHAQVQFGWGGLQAGSSGGPLGSGWRGA